MTTEQLLILAILGAAIGMFLWGRWRHDMVAIATLLACVITGLVPANDAFAGFGHPAVITVACVLVLNHALQASGAVDALTRALLPAQAGVTASLAALIGLGALLSGFMNNIGAMALLMPVAIQLAGRLRLAPGQVLMPLAFGTILGGMTTLIGTPPNLIVSAFRDESVGKDFAMFDFTFAGLPVAAAGVAFVALVGWRLVPARARSGVEGFVAGAYLTEARVPEGSKAVGQSLQELETALEESDVQIVGLVHRELRLTAPASWRKVRAGDILVLEAEAESLPEALSKLGLTLEEAVARKKDEEAEAEPEPQESVLMEIVVLPRSSLAGRSASDLRLRTRFGLNLLALSRRGRSSRKRLRSVRIESGDLLLMQGPPAAIREFTADHGCVPLAERELRMPDRRKAWEAGLIMALAVGGAAFGLVPAAISFAAGVLLTMALRTVPLRAVYEAVDWPVIVLLAALIPVAGAMETTGTADLLARVLLVHVAQGHPVGALVVLLIVTMCLSDLMNNAATAAVMCPIAIGSAAALSVNPDSFLMAVALGASCAFLTPIGHQSNTLILGPGGFRFGDYWRLGVPLEAIVALVGVPMLLYAWPL